MKPTEARAAFPRLLDEITEVLLRHDPSGLFSAGAPRDEHDDDIHRIVSLLQDTHGPDDVPGILESVMGDWIASSGDNPKEMCRAMAPAIWAAWKKFRDKAV